MSRTAIATSEWLTRQQLADRLNVTPMTITRWERDGCPVAKKSPRGKPSLFDPDAVERWRTLTDAAKATEGLSLEHERALLAREQRLRTEMENRVRRGELVELAAVVLAGQSYTKAWVAKVRALPRQMVKAGLIGREHEAAVAALLRDLLAEIAGWETVGQAAAAEKQAS